MEKEQLKERINEVYDFMDFLYRLRDSYPESDYELWEMMEQTIYAHYCNLCDKLNDNLSLEGEGK